MYQGPIDEGGKETWAENASKTVQVGEELTTLYTEM